MKILQTYRMGKERGKGRVRGKRKGKKSLLDPKNQSPCTHCGSMQMQKYAYWSCMYKRKRIEA
jgi:hypothetical protein